MTARWSCFHICEPIGHCLPAVSDPDRKCKEGCEKIYEYDEECLKTFLKKQGQLFDEPVAETLEEAEAFLEDCMAVIADSLDEVKSYLEEEGMDIDGMSADEIEDASEIFPLPDGRYLIVEG